MISVHFHTNEIPLKLKHEVSPYIIILRKCMLLLIKQLRYLSKNVLFA